MSPTTLVANDAFGYLVYQCRKWWSFWWQSNEHLHECIPPTKFWQMHLFGWDITSTSKDFVELEVALMTNTGQ